MTALLLLSVTAVVVVNGWTDAPGALTTVVCSGALPYRRAAALAAAGNAAGVLLAGIFLPRVADRMLTLADFSGMGTRAETLLLCWVMWSVSLWGTLAWRWGIPTSESHALLAALAGAASAVEGGFSPVLWREVWLGLFFSAAAGYLLSLICTRRQGGKAPRGRQLLYAGGLAFLHGAQDGQKYTAMLCAAGLGADAFGGFASVLLCAAAMGLGSSLGGGRIVRSIGDEMAPLDSAASLGTDRVTVVTLGICTLMGLPVSTGTVKVCAAAGAARRQGTLRSRVFLKMWICWLATFPVCLLLGSLGGKILTSPVISQFLH